MYYITRPILIAALLIFQAFTSKGQEQRREKYLGVHAGIETYACNISDKNYIRADVTTFGENNIKYSLTGTYVRNYAGIKAELFSLNRKWGLSTGIRYSYTSGSIWRYSGSNNNQDFFYVLANQNGTTTEYYRVKELHQMSNYMGIPVELRFFPFRAVNFRVFLKIGADLNLLLNSKNDVVFDNANMNTYKSELLALVTPPDPLSVAFHLSGGFKWGKPSKPSLSVETTSDPASNLVEPIIGGGTQISVQIPF